MKFLENLSKTLSDMIGINDNTIFLIISSIIVIIIIDLISKGIIFLNTEFNKNERNLYLFNKKTKITKFNKK